METYQVTVDSAKKSILVRTTNKKYFKEIHVPELSRCNLSPQQDAMSIMHKHNTLIISVRILYYLLHTIFKKTKILCSIGSRNWFDRWKKKPYKCYRMWKLKKPK